MEEWYPEDYDPEEGLQLDGFISDDGKHNVAWELAEVVPGHEYEAWWCKTHNKLYYGGCEKGAANGN